MRYERGSGVLARDASVDELVRVCAWRALTYGSDVSRSQGAAALDDWTNLMPSDFAFASPRHAFAPRLFMRFIQSAPPTFRNSTRPSIPDDASAHVDGTDARTNNRHLLKLVAAMWIHLSCCQIRTT